MDIEIGHSTRFDGRRLEHMCRRLDAHYLQSGRLPHLQLAVWADGEKALDWVAGRANEAGDALSADALYRIASMTKPVTSVAFMMLVERGLVALDTPVQTVIPEFAGLEVVSAPDPSARSGPPLAARPMLMIDLMRHTAGFTYSFQECTAVDRLYAERQLDVFHQKRTPEEYIAAIAELPLLFSPGEGWNYSIATDILGLVVERVSGVTLEQFFADMIFTPLGMDDSFFVVPPDKLSRLTDAWQAGPDGTLSLYDRGANSRWRSRPSSYSGGGGLVSSCADYGRFCAMLLNGGAVDDVRILAPKTIDLMTQNHLPGGGDLASVSTSLFSESTNSGVGFGLGVAVTMDPARAMMPGSAGEYYWGGLLSTAFFVDPVERIVAVLMTQAMPSSAFTIRREWKTMLYSALVESRT
ncbi:serine hydrolase domain-containing protein [Sphingobium subterraneum]|uniref:CubicO group peptidase (Beta-lactamase class C family) n=1 Tax=Sphingobium subterraneum TaxID=627688 RepID=A0A841IW89_9SPHN|nr:serine hydrolase domain-containing protein [Sphingobium subterraneum]MBB6122432.1 CubicO group peptidase (beta-lactamase class C family) [Sphingobium subterraneum]